VADARDDGTVLYVLVTAPRVASCFPYCKVEDNTPNNDRSESELSAARPIHCSVETTPSRSWLASY